MTHLGESYDRPNDGYTDRPEPSQTVRRLRVPEAAEFLGITTDAVRSRMRRGKIRREEGKEGTVYVLLEDNVHYNPKASENGQETGNQTVVNGRETTDDGLLVKHMASEIDHLRGQLEEAHAAHRENRRIIATLTQRIPELVAAAPQATPEAPVTASEGNNGEERPEPVERRSWWREFFGF